MPTILVVEDDEPHRQAMTLALGRRGFDVIGAADGAAAGHAVEQSRPDLILLDLGLPDIDGVDLCRHLHTWPGSPIIIVSAHHDDERVIAGLNAGANDYVTKPVAVDVLAARIAVQLRQATRIAPLLEQELITVGDVTIDLAAHEARAGGQRVELRAQPFSILSVLGRNVDRIVTHEVLLRALGADDDDSARNSLRINVSRLRAALGTGPNRPTIVSERHVGYRLVPPSA